MNFLYNLLLKVYKLSKTLYMSISFSSCLGPLKCHHCFQSSYTHLQVSLALWCVLGRPWFQDEVSSQRRAGKLGMGRTGDSLHFEFPPRSGGWSPHREELLVGRKRGGPWVRWLLLLLLLLIIIIVFIVIILYISIVEPGRPCRLLLA